MESFRWASLNPRHELLILLCSFDRHMLSIGILGTCSLLPVSHKDSTRLSSRLRLSTCALPNTQPYATPPAFGARTHSMSFQNNTMSENLQSRLGLGSLLFDYRLTNSPTSPMVKFYMLSLVGWYCRPADGNDTIRRNEWQSHVRIWTWEFPCCFASLFHAMCPVWVLFSMLVRCLLSSFNERGPCSSGIFILALENSLTVHGSGREWSCLTCDLSSTDQVFKLQLSKPNLKVHWCRAEEIKSDDDFSWSDSVRV